jgi:hypothetical protein
LAVAAVSACGGDDGPSRDRARAPEPVSESQAFPAPGGRTLAELRRGFGPGPRLATSVSVLQPGRARIAFALFDRARRQISQTPTALYVARADGTGVRGPYEARYLSLTVKERFQSDTTHGDPDSAHSIYVARPDFPEPGDYRVVAVARLDQRLVGAAPVTMSVRRDSTPPEVGERAPRVHTPTLASAGGDLTEIDTRQPPSTMHDEDLVDVLGRRPVMLLFATPGLCASRICGPVADIAEQLKAERGDEAEFIHVEIYRDNDPQAGQRSQVRAYGLPSEPWLFAIDRAGRVAARIEGAFSAGEAEAALRAATDAGT